MNAAVEKEREQQEALSDKISGARNMAIRAYASASGSSFFDGRKERDRGDEALPDVEYGEGEPPEVQYNQGMSRILGYRVAI